MFHLRHQEQMNLSLSVAWGTFLYDAEPTCHGAYEERDTPSSSALSLKRCRGLACA